MGFFGKSDEEKKNDDGFFYLKERDFDAALSCFDESIEINTSDTRSKKKQLLKSFEGKSRVFESQCMWAKVLNCMDLIQQNFSLNPSFNEFDLDKEIWNRKGYAELMLGLFSNAEVSFHSSLDFFNREDYNAWFYRGVASHVMGHYRESEEYYDQAILHCTLDPPWKIYLHKGLLNAAYANFVERDDENRFKNFHLSAIESYDKIIDGRQEFYFNEAGAMNEIIRSFTEYSALIAKGKSLYKLQKYEESIACFDKCEKKSIEIGKSTYKRWKDKESDALIDKGKSLYKLQKYEESIAYFDKSLKLMPENGFAHAGKGKVLSQLGRYEEFIAYFDKSIKLNIALSNSRFSTPKLDESYLYSLQPFLDHNRLNFHIANVLFSKGKVLMTLGYKLEAEECFHTSKLLEVDKEKNMDKLKTMKFSDPLNILKLRLAKGEITIEEFKKIKGILE